MDIFEFSNDVSEMNEGELRATLVDLVAKHNEQVEESDDYEAQIGDLEGEVEEYREDAESARAFFSELVGEQKDMDAELLAEKFTSTELQEQVDMEAFTQDSDASDDDSTFADKEQKSDDLPGEEDDLAEYRTDARASLARLGIISADN